MRIEKRTGTTGLWGLEAVPEDYDGLPPLRTVWFDRQPRQLSPDRVALASYLLFSRWISGRFAAPQPHSPALAQAISNDARPLWIQTEPVELYAKAIPDGQTSLRVIVEGTLQDELQLRDTDRGERTLRLGRSDKSAGTRMSFGSLELSTNAWLFGYGKDANTQLRVIAACAVLFCEDMNAHSCIVPLAGATGDSEHRLRALLSAVGLGLTVVSASVP